MLLDASSKLSVIVPQPMGDRLERRIVQRVACVDQERDRRRPAIRDVQDTAHRVQVKPQHVVVVGL